MGTTVQLDVKRLIAEFGGPTALHELLQRRGHALALKTINQWGWRNRIPGNWLAEMSTLAEERGRPLRLSKYKLKGAGEQDLSFLE